MKKKRKGCRNCKHGSVLRHGSTWSELGKISFPEIICHGRNESGWDRLHQFGDCCDRHEWRFNSNICPKCGGRATKMLRLNKSKPYLCQQCDHEYARPQEAAK